MSIAVITVIKYSNNGKKIVPDPMYNSAPLWRSQLPSHKMMLANLDLPCIQFISKDRCGSSTKASAQVFSRWMLLHKYTEIHC